MTTQVKGCNFFIEDGTVNFFKPLFKKLSRRGLKSMMYILMILSFILCTSAMHHTIGGTNLYTPTIKHDTAYDQDTVNLRCNMPYQDIIGKIDDFLNECTLELKKKFSKWSSLRCMHIEPQPLNDISPSYPTKLTLLGYSKDCDGIKEEFIGEKEISIQLENFEMILAAIPVKVETSIPTLELLSNYKIYELRQFLEKHKVIPIGIKKDPIHLQAKKLRIELITKNASGLINDAFEFTHAVYMIESEIKVYNDQLKDKTNVIRMDTQEIVYLPNREYIPFYACVGIFSSTDDMMLNRKEGCTPHLINYHIPTHTLTVPINYYQYHAPIYTFQHGYLYTMDEVIKIDPVFLARDQEDNDRSIFLRVDHISKISFIGSIPDSIPYPTVFLEVQINNCNYYLKIDTNTKNYQLLEIKENE